MCIYPNREIALTLKMISDWAAVSTRPQIGPHADVARGKADKVDWTYSLLVGEDLAQLHSPKLHIWWMWRSYMGTSYLVVLLQRHAPRSPVARHITKGMSRTSVTIYTGKKNIYIGVFLFCMAHFRFINLWYHIYFPFFAMFYPQYINTCEVCPNCSALPNFFELVS